MPLGNVASIWPVPHLCCPRPVARPTTTELPSHHAILRPGLAAGAPKSNTVPNDNGLQLKRIRWWPAPQERRGTEQHPHSTTIRITEKHGEDKTFAPAPAPASRKSSVLHAADQMSHRPRVVLRCAEARRPRRIEVGSDGGARLALPRFGARAGECLDALLVRGKRGGATGIDYLAIIQDISVVGDLEAHAHILLDE